MMWPLMNEPVGNADNSLSLREWDAAHCAIAILFNAYRRLR